MRIFHLVNHCRFGNGNVHAAVDLACAQAAAGHSPVLLSEGGDFVDLLERNGVAHIVLPQNHRKLPALLSSVSKLVGHIKRHKPDILHAHMMTGAILGRAAGTMTGIPLVTTVHNAFDSHSILMGLGDQVIGVSQAVSDQMGARGIKAKKLNTVMNGTRGVARRQGASRAPVGLQRPSITTLCGLHDRKGVKHLIDAFDLVSQRHPDAHLYIIGEGPSEKIYQAQAAELRHSDRVHFLGQLRDPEAYLRESDIFALASLQDPCPLVIPEAREAGCAIVATHVDGIPEMLKIGAAGVTVPPADGLAMGEAMCRLLDDAEALAASKAASLDGVAYFDISRVERETRAVYGRALASRNRPVEAATTEAKVLEEVNG
jgi:glycosyltransferase involved in cell wall biosynthesis